MTSQRNVETQKAISTEIKLVQGRCIEAINIIANSCPESEISPEEVADKTLSYVEALRTEIQNSNTAISTDVNLLTSQFLSEVQEKTMQLEELAAFMKGSIADVDTEIHRITEQIEMSKEARSHPVERKQQIRAEHMKKARDLFQFFKSELHTLLVTLYPDSAEDMKELLANLMKEQMDESSSGYIPIPVDKYRLVELLLERNIVSFNPYNNTEIKLAF